MRTIESGEPDHGRENLPVADFLFNATFADLSP
jgi:hypothetical protein